MKNLSVGGGAFSATGTPSVESRAGGAAESELGIEGGPGARLDECARQMLRNSVPRQAKSATVAHFPTAGGWVP